MQVQFLGRSAELVWLRQACTYWGMIEGIPNARDNQRLIDGLLVDPMNRSYGVAPFLVPPVQTVLPERTVNPHPLGPASLLPSVKCIARFASLHPTAPGLGDVSGITVIWFQETFALPIDQEVLVRLSQLEWSSNAGNEEW